MTSRWGRGSRAGRLLLLVVLGSLPAACAERIGQKAAEGAMKSMREEAANPTGGVPASQLAAQRAVKGAIDALDDPEQQARIQRMVSQAVAAVTRTMVEDAAAELVAQLGTDGSGPLAVSLSQTGQRVSASVAGGVVGAVGSELATLVPECNGPNRAACLQQRLQETTRSTAAAFSKGVRDTLGWQSLLLAFVLGAAGGALGSWLWSLRVARRSWRTA